MEKLIIFGRVFGRDKKDGSGRFYKIEYLDANTGESKSEYFESVTEYNKVAEQNIPVGTLCTGIISLNSSNRGYCSDVRL